MLPRLLSVHVQYVLISFIVNIHCKQYEYSQFEIDTAWQKMVKREHFFKPLEKQIGCWPQNTIPYTILDGFTYDQIEHIKKHIYQIQNKTCLRWVEAKLLTDVRKEVVFRRNKKDPEDCHTSEAGDSKIGIKTWVVLGDECFPYESVIHEMMHALGFLHEHQRIDRDCYVIVKESYAQTDLDFKIIYDDDAFEKWPYDKRSVTHYSRLSYALRDIDEPWGGILWRHRLGDSYGWWGTAGRRTGQLTCLDVHKIRYRYCGAPDFCEIQPRMCEQTEEEEVRSGCKELYEIIATRKVIPNPTPDFG